MSIAPSAPSEQQRLSSRHMIVSVSDGVVSIACELSRGITLGSPCREKNLRKKLKARMIRWRPLKVSVVGIAALFEVTDINHVRRAIDDLDRTLDSFMEDKLQPKEVEEILGITSNRSIVHRSDSPDQMIRTTSIRSMLGTSITTRPFEICVAASRLATISRAQPKRFPSGIAMETSCRPTG